MKRRMLIQVVCVVCLSMFAFSGAVMAQSLKIGVAMDNLNDPFWVGIKRGIDDAGKDLGVEIVFRTAEGDAVKQNNQIDDR